MNKELPDRLHPEMKHWLMPFMEWVIEWGYDDDVAWLRFDIPRDIYNWNGVDAEALRERGVLNLQLEKKGARPTFDVGSVFPTGHTFDSWGIYIKIKRYTNEEARSLDNGQHERRQKHTKTPAVRRIRN